MAIKVQKGFTLIEVLVVIAIIGLLVGITIPVMSMAMKSGQRATSTSNLRQIGMALRSYIEDSGGYPRAGADGLVRSGHLSESILLAPGDPFKEGYAKRIRACKPWDLPFDYPQSYETVIYDFAVLDGAWLANLKKYDSNPGMFIARTHGTWNSDSDGRCANIDFHFVGSYLRLREDGSVISRTITLKEPRLSTNLGTSYGPGYCRLWSYVDGNPKELCR